MQLKPIVVQKKEFFETWLRWLDPVLGLKVDERKILAALITLHYYHRHRIDNPYTLNEMLFMPSNLNFLKQKLSMQKAQFEKALKSLKDKKCIITERIDPEKSREETTFINPSFTKYPKDDNFKINIEFKIV